MPLFSLTFALVHQAKNPGSGEGLYIKSHRQSLWALDRPLGQACQSSKLAHSTVLQGTVTVVNTRKFFLGLWPPAPPWKGPDALMRRILTHLRREGIQVPAAIRKGSPVEIESSSKKTIAFQAFFQQQGTEKYPS